MSEIETIIKECFWDYDFSENDISNILENGSEKEKIFIFSKILENSCNVLKALKIFNDIELSELLRLYKVPKFNSDFLNKRYKIIKYLILKESVDIPELKWRI